MWRLSREAPNRQVEVSEGIEVSEIRPGWPRSSRSPTDREPWCAAQGIAAALAEDPAEQGREELVGEEIQEGAWPSRPSDTRGGEPLTNSRVARSRGL